MHWKSLQAFLFALMAQSNFVRRDLNFHYIYRILTNIHLYLVAFNSTTLQPLYQIDVARYADTKFAPSFNFMGSNGLLVAFSTTSNRINCKYEYTDTPRVIYANVALSRPISEVIQNNSDSCWSSDNARWYVRINGAKLQSNDDLS